MSALSEHVRRLLARADALLLDLTLAVAHACCRLIGHDPIPTKPPYCRRCGDLYPYPRGVTMKHTLRRVAAMIAALAAAVVLTVTLAAPASAATGWRCGIPGNYLALVHSCGIRQAWTWWGPHGTMYRWLR